MILYPDVQKRAQEEVDRVTGCKRLPEYEDQESMPYIKALVREVVRWKPLLPLGLAHANNKSDTYKGYFIPKGVSTFLSFSDAEVEWENMNRQYHPCKRLASGHAGVLLC